MPRTKTKPTPATRGRPRVRRIANRSIAPRNLTDVDLLTRAIADTAGADGVTPITDRDFAATVLKCHDRTLRKYLRGAPLPPLARDKLVDLLQSK